MSVFGDQGSRELLGGEWTQVLERLADSDQLYRDAEGGYRVRDSRGRTLCYIYCRDDEKNAEVANVLTWDEGRRVAANIASCQSY